jgi:hypothetical protein
MKLTTAQIVDVIDQVGADPVPEQDPAASQLEEAFGAHTFFLNDDGLHVVEPTGQMNSGSYKAHFIRLASWGDEEKTILAAHEAEVSGTVDLETEEGPDPAA